MKPEEKAKELRDKIIANTRIGWKRSALIAVDEILNSDPLSPSKFDDRIDKLAAYNKCEEESYQFWQEVKQEIEKL